MNHVRDGCCEESQSSVRTVSTLLAGRQFLERTVLHLPAMKGNAMPVQEGLVSIAPYSQCTSTPSYDITRVTCDQDLSVRRRETGHTLLPRRAKQDPCLLGSLAGQSSERDTQRWQFHGTPSLDLPVGALRIEACHFLVLVSRWTTSWNAGVLPVQRVCERLRNYPVKIHKRMRPISM